MKKKYTTAIIVLLALLCPLTVLAQRDKSMQLDEYQESLKMMCEKHIGDKSNTDSEDKSSIDPEKVANHCIHIKTYSCERFDEYKREIYESRRCCGILLHDKGTYNKALEFQQAAQECSDSMTSRLDQALILRDMKEFKSIIKLLESSLKEFDHEQCETVCDLARKLLDETKQKLFNVKININPPDAAAELTELTVEATDLYRKESLTNRSGVIKLSLDPGQYNVRVFHSFFMDYSMLITVNDSTITVNTINGLNQHIKRYENSENKCELNINMEPIGYDSKRRYSWWYPISSAGLGAIIAGLAYDKEKSINRDLRDIQRQIDPANKDVLNYPGCVDCDELVTRADSLQRDYKIVNVMYAISGVLFATTIGLTLYNQRKRKDRKKNIDKFSILPSVNPLVGNDLVGFELNAIF